MLVDFSITSGPIKPMNAVNNGPTRSKELNNIGNVPEESRLSQNKNITKI